MPAPRKITDAQRERIRQVAEARAKLPSDKELANECGVSVWAIRWTMLQFFGVSRGTHKCELMIDGRSRPDRIHIPAGSDQ